MIVWSIFKPLVPKKVLANTFVLGKYSVYMCIQRVVFVYMYIVCLYLCWVATRYLMCSYT